MDDTTMPTLDYLRSLPREQMQEAVLALPVHERKALVADLCKTVNAMAQAVVQNADAIWASRNTGDSTND